MALQSLSEYAALAYSGHLNLTVSLASTNMDLQQHFELNEDTSDVSHTAPIPTIPTGIFVSAVGEGCALMQVGVMHLGPHLPALQSSTGNTGVSAICSLSFTYT